MKRLGVEPHYPTEPFPECFAWRLLEQEFGIAPHVVDAILNHVSGKTSGKAGVSGTYNHATYFAERKAAHLRWEDYILALASGGARKVIPLRRERA